MVTFMRPTKGDTQSDTEDFVKDFVKELTERQRIILDMIVADASLTAKAISEKMSKKDSVTERTIQNDLAQLKKMGILSREGGRKEGRWVIVNKQGD